MDPLRDLRSYAEDLVSGVNADDGARAARTALLAGVHSPWMRRVVSVATAVAMFIGANAGLAAATNGAVPGDALYGLDRAYEKIGHVFGIDSDGPEERFEEAAVLAHRGRFAEALETAAEAAEQLDNPGLIRAAEALSEAADNARGVGPPDYPPGLQQQLNRQTQELFGIGRTVSEVAKAGKSTKTLTAAFSKKAEDVLEAVKQAKADRGSPPGKETPPGQSNKSR